MKALFVEQIRYREFLWNIKSSFYLRKSTKYAMQTNISNRAIKTLNDDRGNCSGLALSFT